MTSGTKSYLFGCHGFLMHPLMVLLAWRKRYGGWPALWQVVCIFIHDVGIVGMEYLKDSKDGHWKRGALIARRLFGEKGYEFCAGHVNDSGVKRSNLFWADKGSWLVAPNWWLWTNYRVEQFEGAWNPVEWKRVVGENLAKEDPMDCHAIYLKRRREEAVEKGFF